MSMMQEWFDKTIREAKKELFEAISRDCEVFVAVNLEHEGVRLPEHLKQGDRIAIKFSHRYEYKLDVEEEGVSQVLRFGGEDFPVFVAWDAIFTISEECGGRHATWPFHGPKALRPEEPVWFQLDEDTQVILHPDGTVRSPEYIH
jgi:hypothetical protein